MGMKARELVLLFTCYSTWKSRPCPKPGQHCRTGSGSTGKLSTTTQAQFQNFELARPNIYTIYELLVREKGPVLQY